MYDNTLELCNEYLEIYFNAYKALSDAQKRKLVSKYDHNNLFLETYICDVWSENEKLTDTIWGKDDKEKTVDLSDVLPLKDYEELKTKRKKRIKKFNSKQIVS